MSCHIASFVYGCEVGSLRPEGVSAPGAPAPQRDDVVVLILAPSRLSSVTCVGKGPAAMAVQRVAFFWVILISKGATCDRGTVRVIIR